MKHQSITRLLTAVLFGCFLATSSGAQTAPNTEVIDGRLVIYDNDGNIVQEIDPPAGEEAGGNLVIGGRVIEPPIVSIDGDNNLVLADERILQVPELPDFGERMGVEAVFGDTIVGLDGKQPDTDGWYFSYNLKGVYHFGASDPDYIFVERMGSFFYVDPSAESLADGIWVYGFDFPTAGNDSWIYMQTGSGFFVDVRDLEGTSQSQKRIIDSYLFIDTVAGGQGGIYQFLESSARTSAFVAPAGSGDFVQVWPRN